jgi:lipopolysaccharide export system permease protein
MARLERRRVASEEIACMKYGFKKLDVYAAKNVILAIALVWLALTSFQLVLAFAENAPQVGKNNYTLSHAFLETILTIPRRAYEVFPTVGLIGTVLGLGGMSARSELTAMRSVGFSRWRIGFSALLVVFMAASLLLVAMESFGVVADKRAYALSNAWGEKQLTMAHYSGLWAREGNIYLNARRGAERDVGGVQRVVLDGLRLYEFDSEGRLLSIANARQAIRMQDSWQMLDVQRTRFAQTSVSTETKPQELWKSFIDEKILVAAITRPRYMRMHELRSNIQFLRKNKLDTHAFEASYWSRWFYPLTTVLLTLAGLPFVFGSLRSGGFGKRLFFGITIGIGFWIAQQVTLNLADVYRVDVRIALIVPLFVLLGFALWMMRAQND